MIDHSDGGSMAWVYSYCKGIAAIWSRPSPNKPSNIEIILYIAIYSYNMKSERHTPLNRIERRRRGKEIISTY